MSHKTPQDHQSKRQRLTPSSNELWMEAILNKDMTSDGYISTSTITSGKTTIATISAEDWSEKTVLPQPLMIQQGPRQQDQGRSTYKGSMMTTPLVMENTTRAERVLAYQTRLMDGDVVYQKNPANGGECQQEKSIQDQQGRAVEMSTANLYQGSHVARTLGMTTVDDYKRNRKLPPRVKQMLREQLNLNEDVLHDAFALAMEDLILEQEASFVAQGLCHLCGAKETHYGPVVSFCPHADENHSLCREHLRSAYRVRLEALFVGKNGMAPNRHLLRCLVCTLGCPCTMCRAEKERTVHKYKCYLLNTLRRSGQGSVTVMRYDRATTAVGSPVSKGRSTDSAVQSSSKSRQYIQHRPTYTMEDCSFVHCNKTPARNMETEAAHEGCGLVQPREFEYKEHPHKSRANGYGSRMQIFSMEACSTTTSSMQASLEVSNMPALRIQLSSIQASSMHTSSIGAPQNHTSQYASIPQQVEKDTSGDILSVKTDITPAAVQAASLHVHPNSMKSSSSATIRNCTESEKSVVQLLSSLNQGGASAGFDATNDKSLISKGRVYNQSESRYFTNNVVANNETSRSGQGGNGTEMVAAPVVYPARRIAKRRCQADSVWTHQSSTSSMDSGDSSLYESLDSDARSVNGRQVLKRKANKREVEASPKLHDSTNMSSRDDSRMLLRGENAANVQQNESQHHDQAETGLNGKPNVCGKEDTLKNDSNGKHSLQIPPPQREPGRSRKASVDTTAIAVSSLRAGKKGIRQRKSTARPKRGRGRPPKRAKQAKDNDEKTADERYKREDEKEDDKEEGGSDSELDANLDYCEICQGVGDLVCCDMCPRSFHLKCLHVTDYDLPAGDWQCDECKKPSRFDAYSVAVASEKKILDKCRKIIQCLKSHPFSKQFLLPVENVPMYTRVVKQPMDLSTIENKLINGAYIVDKNTVADDVNELDSAHFANDVRLMWSNCKRFNDDGSGIVRAADILSAGFERLYNESIAPLLAS